MNEHERLADPAWRRWGTYLSERAWGTVREDYSADGDAWSYFPFEHAASRTYRWNEDGLAGWCDDEQNLCFGIGLWNGLDERLKERPYGLTNSQGNHGEDVKDYWFYTDNLPTHAYASMIYKYPLVKFPYEDLLNTNEQRGPDQPEYELFDALESDWRANRYADVQVEYAKAGPEDMLCRVTVTNRSAETHTVHLALQVWFRNTWSWEANAIKPALRADGTSAMTVEHPTLGMRHVVFSGGGTLVFCENETNNKLLFNSPNESATTKDGIENFILNRDASAISTTSGTKGAAVYAMTLGSGQSATFMWRFSEDPVENALDGADEVFAQRLSEADVFYGELHQPLHDDASTVERQALSGLLWCKQFYNYNVRQWLLGDPNQPTPPDDRWSGRNHKWQQIRNSDVILMPDAWEYPWYATWDWSFHCVAMALIDIEFAKDQLKLMTSPRYQHPHGQIPAYEWNFSDTNPPVQAWATWQVYSFEKFRTGKGDRAFLERSFRSLMMQLMAWYADADPENDGLFSGGFLGMDNIGVFDRDQPLPTGGTLVQVDGSAWTAQMVLQMLEIAIELAREDSSYDEMIQRLLLDYALIARALAQTNNGVNLWSDTLGFYRDVIRMTDGEDSPLDVVSIEGLIPILASIAVPPELQREVKVLADGAQRFAKYYASLAPMFSVGTGGTASRDFFAAVSPERLVTLLQRVLDEDQLLSQYGIRSLSKEYEAKPYSYDVNGQPTVVEYWPAESHNRMFGGNSNWRGPIWFPINLLVIQALLAYNAHFGDDLKVEYPAGSGTQLNLEQVAREISGRLTSIFLRDESGRRAVFGNNDYFQNDPYWRDLVPFYEYFNGDTGAGLGASHQTGWTGTVALLLQYHGGGRFNTVGGKSV